MKKSNKKVKKIGIVSISISIFTLLVIFSIHFLNKKIPTNYFDGSYAIDINDPEVVVGNSDYVFVGKVKGQLDTIYSSNFPFTTYNVEVLTDIKGDLTSYGNETIIYQMGGLSEDGSSYILAEEDELLTDNNIYIFCVRVGSDGKLHIPNPNADINIKEINDNANLNLKKSVSSMANVNNNENYIEEIKQTDTYKEYLNNYVNEKYINRELFEYQP